jgi:hypothetical protein
LLRVLQHSQNEVYALLILCFICSLQVSIASKITPR